MILKIKNLTKIYNEKSKVENINFKIKEGEIVGLIGSNGAGKTTTIKSILHLINHDDGEIFIDDKKVENIFDLQGKISYLPDNPVYYNNLTCKDNLDFVARINNINKKVYKLKINDLINYFDFKIHMNKFPNELSKGNKQKLMIMLSMIQEHELLIADEPFTGLDPIMINSLKNIFINMKKDNKSVLLSTHLLDISEQICDRVIIINNGNIILNDTIDSLKDKYKTLSLEEIYLKVRCEL